MFNVRVYGFLVDELSKALLMSDEWVRSGKIIKLPGGGLQYGEGTKDCLIREMSEELNVDVSVKDHVYTTDFFQESKFKKNEQVISVYYKMVLKDIEALKSIPIHNIATKTDVLKQKKIVFRFQHLDTINQDSFSLPIDKKAILVFLKKINQ